MSAILETYIVPERDVPDYVAAEYSGLFRRISVSSVIIVYLTTFHNMKTNTINIHNKAPISQHIIPNPPESSNIQVSESLSVKVVSPCSCAIAWALPAKDIHGDSPRWAPGLPLGMGRRAARWSHGCKARLAKRCASAMAFHKHWQYCLVS